MTILNWKKSGRLRRVGPPKKNRHGKESYDYELVTGGPVVTKTPKWQLFERKCKAGGKDPAKVLELLLSRCRSEYMGKASFGVYGDPDLFAVALYVVLVGAPSFLDTIFHGGGPPSALETHIGELIYADGGAPLALDCPSFGEAWVAAKTYVGSSLQSGEWRYNVNPSVVNFYGKPALLMRARWHNELSSPHAAALLDYLGLAYSTARGEFSSDPDMDAFLLRVNKLQLEFGDEMKNKTQGALKQFRWLWLGNDGEETDFGTAFETQEQKAALRWLAEHTGARRDHVVSFAYAWARRYQGKTSQRPTQTLINAIFQTTGGVSIPRTDDWNPEDCAAVKPKWCSCDSEGKLDWMLAHHCPPLIQDGPRPGKKTQHEHSSDAGGKRERKWHRAMEKQESDGQPVSQWQEWNDGYRDYY